MLELSPPSSSYYYSQLNKTVFLYMKKLYNSSKCWLQMLIQVNSRANNKYENKSGYMHPMHTV